MQNGIGTSFLPESLIDPRLATSGTGYLISNNHVVEGAISVPVQPGNSGGALVDERGNVVGVVSAKRNPESFRGCGRAGRCSRRAG